MLSREHIRSSDHGQRRRFETEVFLFAYLAFKYARLILCRDGPRLAWDVDQGDIGLRICLNLSDVFFFL